MSNYTPKIVVGEITKVGDTLGSALGSVTVYERDGAGNIMACSGASVPVAKAGYAIGGTFFKTSGGRAGCLFRNLGTVASCMFIRESALMRTEYGFTDAKLVACSNGVTAFTSGTRLPVPVDDLAFAAYGVSDDQDQIQLVNVTAQDTVGCTIVDPLVAHSIYWATLRAGGPANFEVFAAGLHTTVGGGVTEAKTVTGVLATDIVLAQINTLGTGSRTLGKAVPTANTITFTLSGDPVANHIINYVVLRQAGSFKPSHYVVAAGSYSCLTADAAAMAITVAGLLTTDIPFAVISTTNDSDVIISSKVTAANTLTITNSADPDVDGTHVFDYFVLRAL